MVQQPVKEQRKTRQRAAVDQVLDEVDDFISAQDLHQVLRSRGSQVGLATVYRALQAMADDGRVDVLRSDAGEAVYRRCAEIDHHHHLVCRSCGAAVELDARAVEKWATALAAQHAYTDVEHTAELFGLCPACSAR